MLDCSQDLDAQAKSKELALNRSPPLDVIFQVAGGCGLGALNARGEHDRWGIGSTPTSRFSARTSSRAPRRASTRRSS